VKPQMITTSKNLDQYHYDRRNCYFGHEKELKYFKFYTQSNCELECLTNFTRQECGCVKFSMPSNYLSLIVIFVTS
jgi:amiloride-sensitive sodium channel